MEKISINKGGSYSTNFIDENNVFVGWDENQDCCENFGSFLYKFKDGERMLFLGETKGYLFDKNYFNENFDLDELEKLTGEEYWDDENNFAEFRLTKENEEDVYLVLFNSHNGYYGHGFEFVIEGSIKQEGYL